jgi:3-oxoadipate enol-lactonase
MMGQGMAMGRVRLDVETVGEGRPLVLLNSLLSDRGSYAPLAARLAGHRRCILVNLPGFGASPPTEPALLAYANRVAELFDDLALPRETDVLGNGFGGFVALMLASRHGERFDRLVLVGSGVRFPDAGRATFRGMADKAEREGMATLAEAAMRRMFPDDFLAAHSEVVAEREAAFRRIDVTVFAAACRMLAAMDLADELPKVRNRTLVIAGEQDSATPPALGRELAARLPNAEMVEMPGAGHTPHLQATNAFVRVVTPFLGIDERRA